MYMLTHTKGVRQAPQVPDGTDGQEGGPGLSRETDAWGPRERGYCGVGMQLSVLLYFCFFLDL